MQVKTGLEEKYPKSLFIFQNASPKFQFVNDQIPVEESKKAVRGERLKRQISPEQIIMDEGLQAEIKKIEMKYCQSGAALGKRLRQRGWLTVEGWIQAAGLRVCSFARVRFLPTALRGVLGTHTQRYQRKYIFKNKLSRHFFRFFYYS